MEEPFENCPKSFFILHQITDYWGSYQGHGQGQDCFSKKA
jgi:hypothetical protein